MKVYKLAVFGNPIEHSLSPKIHHIFAEQTNINLEYTKKLIAEEKFEEEVINFFNNGGHGLNITLPFKERAYQLSALKTKRCISAKAANTLMLKDGKIYADNTDGPGFIKDISRHIDLTNKSILIIGAGGASRGIVSALLKNKITITNRTFLKAQKLQLDFNNIPKVCELSDLKPEYDIIINTISANNTPNIADDVITNATFCYDLSYNLKSPTSFVANARHYGVDAIDGIGMLIEQAAFAYQIWFGVIPETIDFFEKSLLN